MKHGLVEVVKYGQMPCSAIRVGTCWFAGLMITLAAASVDQARPSELPPGFGPQQARPETYRLVITVKDETGLEVLSALVRLNPPGPHAPLQASTDFAGRAEFAGLAGGAYTVSVEKEGFYARLNTAVQIGQTESVEITLPHEQEYKETVNVVASVPAIDASQTAASERLTGQEIIQLPYPTTRDIR